MATFVRDLDLKPGDILLLKIQGGVGKLVWAMQAINQDLSPWTHVGVVLPGDRLFEAQPGGAVITPLRKYANRPGAVVRHYQRPMRLGGEAVPYRLESLADVLTDEVRGRICDRAFTYRGIGYNWGTYLYLAAYRLGVRPAWLKKRVQDDPRMICSQAADKIYSDEEVHLFADGRMPYDVTPGDLARLA